MYFYVVVYIWYLLYRCYDFNKICFTKNYHLIEIINFAIESERH